jgi:integrase/recombinase XerD
MSIYQEKRNGKPTGLWVIEVTTKGNRQKHYEADLREAKRIESMMKAGVWTPAQQQAERRGYTFGDLGRDAKALHHDHANRVRLERELELVCDLIGRDKLVSEVTTTNLDALVRKLRARPGRKGNKTSSNGTINRYLSSLSGALGWAAERPEKCGLIPRVVFPWLPEDENSSRPVLSAGETQALLDYLYEKHWDRAVVIHTLASTGMRIGELLTIDPRDIKDGFVTLRKTKNGDDRDVPLPEGLSEALGSLLRRGQLPTYLKCKGALYGARKALGLHGDLVMHCFRHTVATQLADGGVSDTNAMRLLGHRSIKTFQRYSRKTKAAALVAAQALPSYRVNAGQNGGGYGHGINATPKSPKDIKELVPRGGIEPPTLRFSEPE